MKSALPDVAPITHLGSRVAFQSPWMTLRVDDVRLLDGQKSEFGVVERAPFAIVIASRREPDTGEPQVLFVQQYRYPIGRWTTELPQGALEAGEDPSVAAARELQEETGYVARDCKVVGTLFEASGFATQHGVVVSCKTDVRGPTALDSAEAGMTSSWLGASELQACLASGMLVDAPSLAALAFLQISGEGEQGTNFARRLLGESG